MKPKDFDIAIVGGGLAGSALAVTMARAGADVALLEKERVFKDRVRGEFLAPWAVRDLRRLDLLRTLRAAGAIDLPALAGRSLKPRRVATPGGDVSLSYSHTAAQEALLAEAGVAGATVFRGAATVAVTQEPGGFATVMTRDAAQTVRARLVVGADGRNSLVRKLLGHEEHVRRTDRVLAGVRLANVPSDGSFGYFVIREDIGGLASIFPQAEGMARAYVFLYGQDQVAYRGPDGFGNFVKSLVELGIPEGAVAGVAQAGPLAAFIADDSWIERPAAPGLALVGDAAGISDPTWGQGMALAFHDARVLSDWLLSEPNWDVALAGYAADRDRYFRTIITAEGWLTELQLTPGDAATDRRNRVMAAWRADPGRAQALDLNGLGPALDVSEPARRWIFAEGDEPGRAADRSATEGLARAVRGRDFAAIRNAFTETARMRALLPGGPREARGPDEIGQAFEGWFGQAEQFEPIATSIDMVADRVRVSWKFRLRWGGEGFSRIIEQQGYAKVVDGRVGVLDLLCSGFRPEPTAREVIQPAA